MGLSLHAESVRALQEWWGVTEEIKAQAQHVQQAGYRVLVPDLYKGKLGVDAEEASHVRSPPPSALRAPRPAQNSNFKDYK